LRGGYVLGAVLVVVMATGLAGCRESERDRPLEFVPGVYKGEKPPALTEEQKRELRERGNVIR
jgi:hypothetical protein